MVGPSQSQVGWSARSADDGDVVADWAAGLADVKHTVDALTVLAARAQGGQGGAGAVAVQLDTDRADNRGAGERGVQTNVRDLPHAKGVVVRDGYLAAVDVGLGDGAAAGQAGPQLELVEAGVGAAAGRGGAADDCEGVDAALGALGHVVAVGEGEGRHALGAVARAAARGEQSRGDAGGLWRRLVASCKAANHAGYENKLLLAVNGLFNKQLLQTDQLKVV